MDKRTVKNNIYSELTGIVKAMANPRRLETLELLAQGVQVRVSVRQVYISLEKNQTQKFNKNDPSLK